MQLSSHQLVLTPHRVLVSFVERELRRHLPGGEFKDVPRNRSMTMSAIRGRGNKTTEFRLRLALVRVGLSGWSVTPREVPGKPDFYFSECKVAAFVDGCFWHGCPKCGHIPKTNSSFWAAKIARNSQRDTVTSKQLRALGHYVLRFWEHDIANRLDHCVSKIKSTVSHRSDPSPRTSNSRVRCAGTITSSPTRLGRYRPPRLPLTGKVAEAVPSKRRPRRNMH